MNTRCQRSGVGPVLLPLRRLMLVFGWHCQSDAMRRLRREAGSLRCVGQKEPRPCHLRRGFESAKAEGRENGIALTDHPPSS